jgi:hypothetical protein
VARSPGRTHRDRRRSRRRSPAALLEGHLEEHAVKVPRAHDHMDVAPSGCAAGALAPRGGRLAHPHLREKCPTPRVFSSSRGPARCVPSGYRDSSSRREDRPCGSSGYASRSRRSDGTVGGSRSSPSTHGIPTSSAPSAWPGPRARCPSGRVAPGSDHPIQSLRFGRNVLSVTSSVGAEGDDSRSRVRRTIRRLRRSRAASLSGTPGLLADILTVHDGKPGRGRVSEARSTCS